MKKHSTIALVLLGALSLGCVKEEVAGQAGHDKVVTLTTTVSLAEAPGTKALTAEGVKTFAVGDQVAIVYTNTADATVKAVSAPLTADDIHYSGKTAILTVSLTDPKPSGTVSFIYPATMAAADGSVNYTALAVQQGSLAALAAGLDLCTFEGSLDTDAALPDCIILNNQLAIGEFTVKDESGNDITSSIVRLTVSDGTDTYTVSRAAGPGPIYVAMKPVSGNLNFVASDGGKTYGKGVTGKALEASNMYPIDVTMAPLFDARVTPLTFEAINACTVTYSFTDPSLTVQYCLNGTDWTDYSAAINLAAGGKVAFRGKNDTYNGHGSFTCSDDCYLYGNIMSLVTDYTTDEFAFANNVTLKGIQTFYELFANCTNIKSHDTRDLVLPATTLTNLCYENMFSGCTGLTAAPALPATTLAYNCYDSMFDGCTGLTIAPALPATTLRDICYHSMFRKCTGLTTAPALPATTLVSGCYKSMFQGCIGLTAAPALPATTLVDHCYDYMFSDCSNLSSITCLADDSIGNNTGGWLFGVADTGTFTRAAGVNWNDGESGIPGSWTVIDYVAPNP